MSLIARARGYARVHMHRSVVGPVAGSHVNLVAGQAYWLRPAIVDELVLKGYGDGAISKGYSDREIERLRERSQTVNIGTGEVT